MINHALALAKHWGFRVFPVFPIRKSNKYKKIPALPDWQNLATTDEVTLRHWWSGTCRVTNKEGKTWTIRKDSAVGICTTDLIVLDVDLKDGPHAFESLELVRQQFSLPKTLVNTTPTGGWHVIYRTPTCVHNQTEWRPGIDIRGDRGYIVGAGSMVEEKQYQWLNVNQTLVDAPPSLVADLSSPSQLIKSTETDPNADFGGGVDYSVMPAKIAAGERDDTLFKYACSWRERSMSKAQANSLMKDLFSRVEQPVGDPLTWAEAKAKIDQAWAAYKAGGTHDVAVTTVPNASLTTTRAAATLKEALEHFVLIEAGSLVADTRRRPDKAVLTLSEFKESMKPDRAGTTELVTAWMRSPHRQTVRDLGYFPQEGLPIFSQDGADYFNTYYGPGMTLPDKADPEIIKVFMDHIDYLYPSALAKSMMLDWMAFTVQYPHLRIPWCFLSISIHEGLGKGLLFELMRQCVGKSNAELVPPDTLTESGGTFNEYLYRKTLVGWDEIKTKEVDYERLRLLITATEMLINRKYGRKSTEYLYPNTIGLSNHMDAINIRMYDRRFFVDCNFSPPKGKAYYDKIVKALGGRLAAHWLRMLKDRDVSRFAWNTAPPDTTFKKILQSGGKNRVETLVQDYISDKVGPFACDIICASVAKNYLSTVSEQYGINAERTDVYQQIANTISNLSPPLPQVKYRIPRAAGAKLPTRVRCKCIRRHEYWSKQPKEAIIAEYMRAEALSLGMSTSALVPVVKKEDAK